MATKRHEDAQKQFVLRLFVAKIGLGLSPVKPIEFEGWIEVMDRHVAGASR